MNEIITQPSNRPGFRLHQLEVFNWGSFDSTPGNVHVVRPCGETTLLIGENGSGKSTLADALVTLMVEPAKRNYNVAAGAGKKERTERTYIRGQYGQTDSDDEEISKLETKFLRDANNYSILLACFRNEEADREFTIAQFLYLNANSGVEKIYCFADSRRSIAEDFRGFTQLDRVAKQLTQRGFKVSRTFSEYQARIAKLTGFKSKAMDIFSQTVAVKDVKKLNDFIRKHMLETKPWGKRVDELLEHFRQLSDAYQSLKKIRRQRDLLEPVESVGSQYQKAEHSLRQLRNVVAAADAFLDTKVCELFPAARDALAAQHAALLEKKQQHESDRQYENDTARRLQNEIENAGDQRYKDIPRLIENQQTKLDAKHQASNRFQRALNQSGLARKVINKSGFDSLRESLPAIAKELGVQIHQANKNRDDQVLKIASISQTLQEDEQELAALLKRRENLPESFAELRRQICEAVRVPIKEVPFVAELIDVKPDQCDWQPSIEMVLKNFGLSLLVPKKHYSIVNRFVEQNRLRDHRGDGRRLVYLAVGASPRSTTGSVIQNDSLLAKLIYREGHSLVPWVKAELLERFDFQCCDDLTSFQHARGAAMTRNRHVKGRGARHEKDDRQKAIDPRSFVLGWDNREKRELLTNAVQENRQRLKKSEIELEKLETELQQLRNRSTAVESLAAFQSFEEINYRYHQDQIRELKLERKALEKGNKTIQLLKEQLAKTESNIKALNCAIESAFRDASNVDHEIKQADVTIADAKARLKQLSKEGALQGMQSVFECIAAEFDQQTLQAATLQKQIHDYKNDKNEQLHRVRDELQPLTENLCAAMSKFLAAFQAEIKNLDNKVEYLDDFLNLLQQIRKDDLPRHEQRFKERLNDKVTQEIGMLNARLQNEQREIVDKIRLLNGSLRQVQYNSGTFMELKPEPVKDPAITEFRNYLSSCLSDSFEGSLEADEARFTRIEQLITRLKGEERWRNKVTDVRNWFDFSASEDDEATGRVRFVYRDSSGQSGGEKGKLAFTILVAAIAYQYDIDPQAAQSDRFHFVIVDEMFARSDDKHSRYALDLFRHFGLQLLIVAPLDAKARITEGYTNCYLHVLKTPATHTSEVATITAQEMQTAIANHDDTQSQAAADLVVENEVSKPR